MSLFTKVNKIPQAIDYAVYKAPDYSGMQVTYLGTSSGVPTKTRSVTSIGLRVATEHWLIDCGEATQTQIRRSGTINIGRINRIFITHMHGDHTWGLLGVIASTLIGANSTQPLNIYGPAGLAEWTTKALRNSITLYPAHLLKIHEFNGTQSNNSISPDKQGTFLVHEDDSIIIRAAPIKHTIPCYGYVFEEKSKKGSLKVDYLKGQGYEPGPFYKEIQNQWQSEKILLSNGHTFDRDDVLEEPVVGRKLVVLGDTCDPQGPLVEIAKDPCLLIHECTLPSGMEKVASRRGHSTGTMAAKFAAALGARSLMLTHFSPRFSDEMLQKEMETVKSLLPDTNVLSASDFDIVDIPKRKKSPDGKVPQIQIARIPATSVEFDEPPPDLDDLETFQ